MRILLINPPRSPWNSILQYAPDEAKHFIHKKLIGPPLGLLTLAGALTDFDVTIAELKAEYDSNPNAPELEVLVEKYLNKVKPDIVGVTFIASEFNDGIRILNKVKQYSPEILTVAGGLHATLCPEDFYLPSVDVICKGQAAGIFKEVIIAFSEKKSFDKIGGIIFKENGKHKMSYALVKPWNAAREDFYFPRRDLIKQWINTYIVGNAPDPSTYIFTSLGCQYQCSFCSIWPQFEKNVFQREIESIIIELKSIDDYAVVRFSDANTIINVNFIDKLCDRILEEGIKKTYVMDIRFDTAAKYPHMIEKLAKIGLKVVICGFESFREEELKKYNKSASAEIIEQAISVFHANDIMLRGNYVVPPDYTESDFEALSEYANRNKVVYAGYTILSPMPGTVYHEEVKSNIIDFDLSKYNFFNSVMQTKLPLEEFYRKVGSLWLIKKGTDVI
ncbi:MAG: radical SAM protein [Bacteroidota bacterium]